jgi:hypothetical protein
MKRASQDLVEGFLARLARDRCKRSSSVDDLQRPKSQWCEKSSSVDDLPRGARPVGGRPQARQPIRARVTRRETTAEAQGVA